MKIYACIHLVLALILAPASASAPSDQIGDDARIRIEIVESFSAKELWNSAVPDSVEVDSVVVDVRAYDVEAQPIDGKWKGCAMLMVGTSDIGTKPVAARLWTTQGCDVALRVLSGFGSKSDARFKMQIAKDLNLEIVVTRELRVLLGGRDVGRIED